MGIYARSLRIDSSGDTVIQLARGLGHPVVEGNMIRSDLYTAEELFVTGTAAEITPVRALDDVEISAPGPITRIVQDAYTDIVHGRIPRWEHFLDYVPSRARVES